MIKGCSKRMIVLKNTGSDFFDEAYFVIKPHRTINSFRGEKAFIDEANRIIKEAIYPQTLFPKTQNQDKKVFFSGAFCGLILGAVLTSALFICF
jgi:hypothetical protein